MADATESGLTVNITVSAAAINSARRSFQASPRRDVGLVEEGVEAALGEGPGQHPGEAQILARIRDEHLGEIGRGGRRLIHRPSQPSTLTRNTKALSSISEWCSTAPAETAI